MQDSNRTISKSSVSLPHSPVVRPYLSIGGFIHGHYSRQRSFLVPERFTDYNRVGEILGELEGRRKNIRGLNQIRNSELDPFPTIIKYGDRGPNLAVSFLKRRIGLNKDERSGNKAYFGVRSGSAKLGARPSWKKIVIVGAHTSRCKTIRIVGQGPKKEPPTFSLVETVPTDSPPTNLSGKPFVRPLLTFMHPLP